MLRYVTALLLACCAVHMQDAIADNELPFLATTDIARSNVPAQPGEPATLTVHVGDPQSALTILASVDGVSVIDSDAGSVRLLFDSRPTFIAAPQQRHLQSSFVIDYDEASVQMLKNDLRARLERQPTPAEITRYVYEHISDKTYSRSFDLASRVAEYGQGDCTEHAVLLAALARAHGYAARVTFGTLIFDVDTDTMAFGHAWTEVYDDSAWHIADATVDSAEDDAIFMRYLPAVALQNEGPGYGLEIMSLLNTMPLKISQYGGNTVKAP